MFERDIYNQLQKWAERTGRKPLVLRGARQVGKTTLVNEFARNFENYLHLNLEREEDARLFQSTDKVQEIMKIACFQKNILLREGRTLLFIDEIQNVPKAVALLRYFYEDMPYTNWNSKEGTILPSDTMETVSNSTFVSVEVPEFGANVHKLWRNPDGSINMGNFLKVADGTTYKDRQIGADLSGDPTILPTPDPTSSPTPSAQPDVTASPSPSSEPKPEYKLLAAVNDGDMNTIDVEFDNNTSIQVEPYIVIAAYKIVEGEEILSDIFDQSYNVEANNSIIFSKAFSDSEYDIIKVFAWQNPNSMIPFDASVNIYPQTEQIIN